MIREFTALTGVPRIDATFHLSKHGVHRACTQTLIALKKDLFESSFASIDRVEREDVVT